MVLISVAFELANQHLTHHTGVALQPVLHALKDERTFLDFIGIIVFFATKAAVFGREHMPLLVWMSVHLFHGQQNGSSCWRY